MDTQVASGTRGSSSYAIHCISTIVGIMVGTDLKARRHLEMRAVRVNQAVDTSRNTTNDSRA